MGRSALYDPRKQSTLTRVYDSVWPIMSLCRIFGTIPIARFKRLGEVVLEVSDRDLLQFVMYLAFNVTLLLYVGHLFMYDKLPINITKFFAVLFLALFVVNLLTTLVMAFWNRKVNQNT